MVVPTLPGDTSGSNSAGQPMAEIRTDSDDDAPIRAEPHQEPRPEKADDRPVQEPGERVEEIDELAEWIQGIGRRLAEEGLGRSAWRQRAAPSPTTW